MLHNSFKSMMSPPNLLDTEQQPANTKGRHQELPRSNNSVEATAFIFLLLAADFLFVLIHCIHYYTPLLNNEVFAINKDHSYAEVFTYVKEFWVIGLLLMLGGRSRKWVFPIWACLFSYILIDDAFMMHERVGYKISRILDFSPMLHLRSRDLGELLVTGFVGVSFLAVAGLIAKRGSSLSRKVTFDLSLLLVILAGFGVGVDMLHVIFGSFVDEGLMMILEDGGEMAAISFFCWYLLSSLSRIRKSKKHRFISPLTGTYHTLINRFNLPQSYQKYLK